MLICELPDPVPGDDNDVIDDVTDRPTLLEAVSVVTSYCERPRNILHPVDLRRRRRRNRRTSHNDTSESQPSSLSSLLNRYLVDFAVCVPPLYGNVRPAEMVEFIEVSCKVEQWRSLFRTNSSIGGLATLLHTLIIFIHQSQW